jgi:hypothetical protein
VLQLLAEHRREQGEESIVELGGWWGCLYGASQECTCR